MTETVRTEKQQARRQAFLEAALRCISKYGYKATSVRKIAEEAGVTAGLLKYYFSGKDELIYEAYNFISESIFEKITVESDRLGVDPIDRLEGFIHGYFLEDILDPELMHVWINFWEVVILDKNIAAKQAEVYKLYQQKLLAFIHEIYSTQARELSDAEALSIAIGINSIVDGLWLECCLNPNRMKPGEAASIVLDFISARIKVTFKSQTYS